MPPMAAKIGSDAFFNEFNSPPIISRLISSPTVKKKIAINPSFIQWCNDATRSILPQTKPTLKSCHKL